MNALDPIRAAWEADSRFQSMLEQKHGKNACKVRYRPQQWDAELAAAWAEVAALTPAMQVASRGLLVKQ